MIKLNAFFKSFGPKKVLRSLDLEVKDGEIVKSGIRAKYFHYKISENDIKLLIALRNKTNYEIVKFLLKMEFMKNLKVQDLLS